MFTFFLFLRKHKIKQKNMYACTGFHPYLKCMKQIISFLIKFNHHTPNTYRGVVLVHDMYRIL